MQEYLYRPPDYCAFIREKFVDNKIIKEYELSLVAHVQGYARDLLHYDPQNRVSGSRVLSENADAFERAPVFPMNWNSDSSHHK